MKIKVAHWLVYFCLLLISGTTLIAQQNQRDDHDEEEDNPQARLDFDFLRTKDPKTGKIPENIRMLELAYMREQTNQLDIPFAAGDISSNWVNRGPFNVGGRTRALAVDMRNENVILAGGVSGGMWRSVDQGASWQKTTGSNELQSVSCIAQDPTSPDTWYYGSGEFSGNSASEAGAFFLGDGVYKSVNNGATWEVLPSTSTDIPESFDQSFDINMEMVVDPTNGDLYVATVSRLFKSSDGGTSFTQVLQDGSSQWVDVVVSSTGTLYAVLDGGGVFTSENGDDWTSITPPSGFTLVRGERKELALAPSNENILYLLGEDIDNTSDHSFWRFDAATGTWIDRSASIPQLGGRTGDFDSQGGYDLLIKVKPDDENFVVIGGTNLFRSTNGFATNGSTWIGGYTPANNSFALYPDHHPDQHAFVFLSNDRAISGNDGGLQITDDVTTSLNSNDPVDWVSINNGYVTTQVYALSAGPGDQILAGFQDNSTWLTTSTASDAVWTDQFGGDGAYNAFNSDGSIRYMSSQNGNIFRVNYNAGADDITADNFTDFAPTGFDAPLFIVPFYLDPIDDDLFYLAGTNSLFVNTQASTGSANVGWKSIGLSGNVSEIGVSTSDVVYAGTTAGDVFRIQNPGGNAVVTDITGGNLPSGYVSGVAVDPSDPNSVLITFSNYGILSVFFTSDAGQTWADVSGNLEENIDGSGSGPSVRSTTILGRGDRYFVGTSTGLYSTTSLNGDVIWTQENSSGIGEVVVEHLVSRSSDGLVLAGTHGNGIYSANFEITPPNERDLGIVLITSPESEIRSTGASETVISASIRNFGASSQNSYDITYSINGEEVSTETINETLAFGEEREVSFSTTFDFSTAGTYSLEVVISLSDDQEEGNNSLTREIVSVTPIETFPFLETFDAAEELPAQWRTENSTLNWLITSRNTPSAETGPLGDNTSGDGNYIYTEATGAVPGDQAFLTTPWLSITGMERPALQFYYHMFGFQMGDLEVLAFDADGALTSLFLLEGQQQSSADEPFIGELISLEAFINSEIRLVFRGVAGSGFRSDMAIDDIKVFNIPNNDLAVTEIVTPDEMVSGTGPVIIEIVNKGIAAQSNFEVSYFVNDVEAATETVSGTLTAGASVEYPFVQQFDFSERGTYEVRAVVSLSGDEDATNDELTETVTNLSFTGYYVMEQEAETSEGPSNQFGNSYLFDEGGISKVFITASSATGRNFDIRYFNYQDFNNVAIPVDFNLNESGETLVTEEVNTGLSCQQNGAIVLGPADANGSFNAEDDGSFSLIIKEDVFQGCQVGSSDVNFIFTKVPSVNEADSLALIALYNSTDGDNWTESWDLDENVFFWEGVVISSAGRVLSVDLIENNLIGTIPSEIGNLTALRNLDVSLNQISGSLPSEIGDLVALEIMGFEFNTIAGNLPPEIGNLTSLEQINFDGNSLSGSLPPEMGALTALTDISFASNNFTGPIPPEFGSMSSLERLTINDNDLEGVIPAELAELTELRALSLIGNRLTGDVPAGFANLNFLENLVLGDNAFTGLPDLSNLDFQLLVVEFNSLDFGDILPNISELTSYEPQADIGDPLTLVGTAGQNLDLITDTPDDGSNEYQWFKGDTPIDGATSATFTLAYTGSADEGLYRCDVTNIGAPDLTLNRFISVVDQAATERPDYAALKALFYATGGNNWLSSTNWLTSEPFENWYGLRTNDDGRVIHMDLEFNNLIGSLPEEFGDIDQLENLLLRLNEISGELPASFWTLSNLRQFILTDNQFSGEIPPEVEGLTNISGFWLDGNNLSGELPNELINLTKLTFLALSNNDFTGGVPSFLGEIKELQFLGLAEMDLGGELPSELGQLSSLTGLRIGNNNLSGEIPSELGALTAMQTLELNGNNFSGALPSSFINLRQMFLLDIQGNNIEDLPDLSSLTRLNGNRFSAGDNKLDFRDILTNISLTRLTYAPQADIDEALEVVVNQGSEYIMGVSDDAEGNVYQWSKDGQSIDGETDLTYTIADFQVVDQGVYTCEVTNPAAPDLILLRNPITLEINLSPTGVTLSAQLIAENEALGTLIGTLSVEGFDEGDEYTWVLSGLDAASFSLDENRLLSNGVFDFETQNSFDITITVKDQGELTAQVDVTISVTNVNEVPVLAIPIDDQVIDEDVAFELLLPEEMFTDEDGDALSIVVTGLPVGLAYDESTRSISGTPVQESVGVSTVNITATDPSNTSAADSFELTVNNVNDAPVVSTEQADKETNEDEAYSYEIPEGTFSDEEDDALTITVTGLPDNLSFDAATNIISGTPLQTDVGVHTIAVKATDPSDASATDSFDLTITNVNDAPVIVTAQEDQSADEDAAFEYEVPVSTFDDEDNDALTLTVSGLPSSLTFDPVSSRISGTPLVADVGSYTVQVTATDPGMLAVTDEFELVVNAVNDVPVLVTELTDVQADRDAPLELIIDPANVTDEEGDAISIAASGLPASLTITNGTISGTPVLGQNGVFNVTITYSDGNGGAVTDSFVLTVNLVTSVEEEKEYGRISIQPNPFTNEIRVIVEKGLIGKTSFSLQPVGGKSVWNSTRNLTGQTELTLQINKSISQGVYLLIINPEGKKPIVRKVIKKE